MARVGMRFGDLSPTNFIQVSREGGLITDIGTNTGSVVLRVTTPAVPGRTVPTTLNLVGVTYPGGAVRLESGSHLKHRAR